MTRLIFSSPYQSGSRGSAASRTAQDATDFLRGHDKVGSLLPTLARMAALQKDCAAVLPDLFPACAVLRYDVERLVFSTPNAALAAKLKQRLPKLQEALLKRGWQVNAIHIKVQMNRPAAKPTASLRNRQLPEQAVSAFSELEDSLGNSPHNAALRAAIQSIIKHHGKGKR